MRRWLLCVATVALMVCFAGKAASVEPNDIQNYQDPDNWTQTKDGAPTASPTCFLADPSQWEHECFFRTGGPIIINVPVTRYVGDVDQLKPAQDRKGLIHKYALVRISAFDVDFNEADSVYVNGHPAKPVFLKGDNCIWSVRGYEVPIEFIHFPDRGSNGQAPIPESNEVKIVIDTGSPQPEYCTAIDWVANRDQGGLAPGMHPWRDFIGTGDGLLPDVANGRGLGPWPPSGAWAAGR